MPSPQTSTLLLTALLGIGLVFFLRAASKDRTTVVEVRSPRPPLEVLNGLDAWLKQRGWSQQGGDVDRCLLEYRGEVASSAPLAILLSLLGTVGAGSLGLVVRQMNPSFNWWPLLMAALGPLAGWIYTQRARRVEEIQIRLIEPDVGEGSTLRLRAHRDELIALELALADPLELASDGALLTSPI
ncbi:cofactor assembly of complex C subunit B [Synechococcus sp. UW179A]|uniref:cofactor assembly of complex C subunit B n=1 Tax=Synechococcus sp. UW179A TaxID=2575510 RepID=UPI000E0EFB75|nr:cofactor assembly of complex C subunit B [Synechococcus sp. UW179A]